MIRLITKCDPKRGLVTRENEGVVNFRANVCHDAAIAHALLRAMSEICSPAEMDRRRNMLARAAEILRDEFGITK